MLDLIPFSTAIPTLGGARIMKPESGRAMHSDHAYTFAGARALRADCAWYLSTMQHSPPQHIKVAIFKFIPN